MAEIFDETDPYEIRQPDPQMVETPAVSFKAEDIPEPPNGGTGPAGAISATPFKPLDLASIPARQWLYGKHYVRKFLSVTGAWGGTGKTQMELTEAVAMATGLPLLGIATPEPLKVWHYNLEEPREELERRLAAPYFLRGSPNPRLGSVSQERGLDGDRHEGRLEGRVSSQMTRSSQRLAPVRVIAQRHQCPSRVNSGPPAPRPFTSAIEGQADVIR